MAPQEAQTTAPRETLEFHISRRYDGEPFDDTVTIALFPCGNVDRDGAITFDDDDSDQAADGVADSDTGEAVITGVKASLHRPASASRVHRAVARWSLRQEVVRPCPP